MGGTVELAVRARDSRSGVVRGRRARSPPAGSVARASSNPSILLARGRDGTLHTSAHRDRGRDSVKLSVEIWRHVDEPDLIHLTHDRFHAQVTDKEGRLGYYPTLYKKLSELLDVSGEPRAGRRQQSEGKRAGQANEPGAGLPELGDESGEAITGGPNGEGSPPP
jgi:hypothetical protein